MRWWYAPVTILALARGVHAQTDSATFTLDQSLHQQFLQDSSTNLLKRSVTIAGGGRVQLPDSLVIDGSVRVTWHGIELLPQDYTVNYAEGTVDFKVDADSTGIFVIEYLVLPFELPLHLQKNILVRTHDDSIPVLVQTESDVDSWTGQLQASGSISRGFSVGSQQDFSLTSGLNIRIQGNVSEDVSVEAVLTDENLPIQPEGNTESIQKIDEVYVRVNKGTEYSAILGDIRAGTEFSDFARYSRELQGLRLDLNKNRVSAKLSVGTSRGSFVSNTLSITDGVQGPYELTGNNGERNILVVAGSEKVWLDGRQLRRGDANDYVIDYAVGQITFTGAVVMTSASRVVVDFEHAEESFRRNSIGGETKFAALPWLTVRSAFVREADDHRNPIGLTLSDPVADSLRQIDDRQLSRQGTRLLVDGSSRTDVGRGNYVKIFDAGSSDSIFVYVGSDSIGNYNVRFTDVGIGQGSYIRGNIVGEFIFVGQGLGSFLPLVPISLPTSNRMAVVGLDLQPRKNWVLKSDFAFSEFDRNRFSKDDLTGRGLDASTSLRDQTIGRFGAVDLDLRYRSVDSSFQPLDRINDVEFDRRWNRPVSIQTGEELMDMTLRYRPRPFMQFSTSLGRLEQDAGFRSLRQGAGISMRHDDDPRIAYDFYTLRSTMPDSVDRRTNVFRDLGMAQYRWNRWLPGVDYESEAVRLHFDRLATGTSYYQWRPRLDYKVEEKLTLQASYEERSEFSEHSEEDSLDGKISTARTIRFQSEYRGDIWKTSASVSRRTKTFAGKFRTTENLDTKGLLVRTAIDGTLWDRFLSFQTQYQISDEQIQERKLVFVEVSPNTGNYIRLGPDSFRQVPTGQGNFIQSSIRSNVFFPVVALLNSWRVRLDFSRIFDDSSVSAIGRMMSRVYSETYLRIEDNQRRPSRSFYWLNPYSFLDGEKTQTGNVFVRQDIFGTSASSRLTLRLRGELQKSLTTVLQDGQERLTRERVGVLAAWEIHERWSAESDWQFEKLSRQSTIRIAGIAGDYFIRKLRQTTSLAYLPTPEWRVQPAIATTIAKDETSGLRFHAVSFMPKLTWSRGLTGQVTMEMDLTRAFIGSPIAPFELTGGYEKGWNVSWLANGEFRLRDHVSLSFSYSAREERNSIIHTASAEFRAFF